MEIKFIAGFGPIVTHTGDAAEVWRDNLGLPLGHGEYLASDEIDGAKHFGLWPLEAAAQACFGTDEWPKERTVPQATIEFEVESPEAVTAAAVELADAGRDMIHEAKEEPWGQTVARMQSADGLLIGITYTPWMH